MNDGIITRSEVREAWRVFNNLPKGENGSHKRVFDAREVAWTYYARIRDIYLIQIGLLRLPRNPFERRQNFLDS